LTTPFTSLIDEASITEMDTVAIFDESCPSKFTAPNKQNHNLAHFMLTI
jgi:hypothetical protein